MENVTEKQWQELISNDEQAVIIDARTPREWAEGVLENAVLMDVMHPMKFEQDTAKLNKNKTYYVYCRSGQRSIRACSMIEQAGIDKTYNLLGGMNGWTGKTVSPAL